MHKLAPILLSAMAGGVTCAAGAPATDDITVLRGQWKFLNESVAFCAGQLPAMQREFADAREHAQEEMRRADDSILEQAGTHRDYYKPYFDTYATGWVRYADTLLQALMRQDPAKACPTLLSSWQNTDVEQILEDWRGYVQRTDIPPPPPTPPPPVHGADL